LRIDIAKDVSSWTHLYLTPHPRSLCVGTNSSTP
jgi:hypothetical protein